MTDYYVAWWNVENLFDTSTSPARPDWLQRKLRSELRGWTEQILRRKISQLSTVIQSMNGGVGPDLLGVCEVENQSVLERLRDSLAPLGRNYGIAHHDNSDQRGIDVAFIYDADLLTWEAQFDYVVLKRAATRDLFQVNFRTNHGRLLMAIGNHWPSRSGGELESEPYRILAAETLSYWLSRIQDIHGRNANVIVMGDLNDEPNDRSVTDYALSTMARGKVTRARNPRLYNLMWPLLGQRDASYYYSSAPIMLDQFLASRGLARTTGDLRVLDDQVEILRFPGGARTPTRFGRPSGGLNRDGFSDHFPIAVTLRERD
ncbi:MAG: endonuclease/exonuclease/phosphatase family protein [Planctomycetota bacterium]